MSSPTRITVAQLSRLIGTPEAPVTLIPTTIRHPFDKIQELVPALLGKKVIVIFQKGLKLSEGVGAIVGRVTRGLNNTIGQ